MNSTDCPRRLLLRSPFMRPTKILRLTSSSCSSLAMNSGERSCGWVCVSADMRVIPGYFPNRLGFDFLNGHPKALVVKVFFERWIAERVRHFLAWVDVFAV